MKAPILYRISSVLLLLFAAGHTVWVRQNNPEWRADAVLALMRSVHFNAQGFTRSYWGLLQRVRAFFLRVSFVRGGIGVAAGRASSRATPSPSPSLSQPQLQCVWLPPRGSKRRQAEP